MIDRSAIRAAKTMGDITRLGKARPLIRSEWVRIGYDPALFPYYVTAFNGIGYRGRKYT